MKILIAEDEISTAKALKLLLEKSKFSVDIVHNGIDAWSYIQSGFCELNDAKQPHLQDCLLGTFRQNFL